MDRVLKLSYLLFFLVLVAVGYFKLATPFLTVLFSYFILNHLKFFNRAWVAISLFMVFVFVGLYASVFFLREVIENLPKLASVSIPVVIGYAERFHVDLPFQDLAGLKSIILGTIVDQVQHIAKWAEVGLKETAFLLIGLVMAINIFLNSKIDLHEGYAISNNFYSLLAHELGERFRKFYQSFRMVMGAQLVIASINTLFTGIFVVVLGLPFSHLIVLLTFVCGLFPIIGNLISNGVIFLVALSQSPQLAFFALLYLIVLHKLEYFLNSKIIGARIKNPMWLTLVALLVGERLMGVPGMILTPVVLHYFKMEGTQMEVKI